MGTTTSTGPAGGTADAAKEQASHLGEKASEAGHQVTGTAKEEASKVVSEARTQAKDLYVGAKEELRDQAGSQQQRVASGLHSISDELSSMARNSESNGVASDLVQQAATRTDSIASWLDARDPGSLLDEVRSFARQRPGTFIALAGVAGVLAGRLTRSIASESSDSAQTSPASTARLTPPTVAPVTYADPAYADPAYPDPTLTGRPGTVGGYGATAGTTPGGTTALGDDPFLGDSRS